MPQITQVDQSGVRVLALARGKANAIDIEMAQELGDALDMARMNDAVRAIVIASTSPTIFSAGFDLQALLAYDNETFDRFVSGFDALVLDLYRYPKPVVAAMTGHTIAGGLILAACADYRIAAQGNGTFGLSEITIGVPIPRACLELMRTSFGDRAVSRLALTGQAVPLDAARTLGLIDEVVAPNDLAATALQRAAWLASQNPETFNQIKRALRTPTAERAEHYRSEGEAEFSASWFSEAAQTRVRALLEKLKSAPA